MRILQEPISFEWNRGNIDKNLEKHKVTNREAEQIFINGPHFILEDEKHSAKEKRYMIWGITNKNKHLSVFFTIRKNSVRVISARPMSKNEKKQYEKV